MFPGAGVQDPSLYASTSYPSISTFLGRSSLGSTSLLIDRPRGIISGYREGNIVTLDTCSWIMTGYREGECLDTGDAAPAPRCRFDKHLSTDIYEVNPLFGGGCPSGGQVRSLGTCDGISDRSVVVVLD